MNSHLTDTPPIQILEESQKGVVQDIKKEVDDSVAMNFGDRIHHPKWQVRRRLYQQVCQTLTEGLPLSNIDPSIQPEQFCIWIKNLLEEPHPSSLNEAIRAIQLFVTKYQLSLKDTNYFIGFFVQKSSSLNINVNKFQAILESCLQTEEVSLGLVLELAKYVESKNNKVALFSLKGLKKIVDKYELAEKRHLDLLFDIATRILETAIQKQIRDIGLSIMVSILPHYKLTFDKLCQTKFKKVRPIVLKELKSMLGDTRQESQEKSNQSEVDLKSLIPTKFFYLHTVTKFDEKRSILAQFEHNLEKSSGSTIAKKDYFQVYNALDSLLEQNNQIVVSITIKILKLLLKSHGQFIPDSNWRRFFSLICDKYKGAKSQNLNQQIHSVITYFWDCRENQVELFVDSCFDIMQKSKSNNAKLGVIDWLAAEYPKLFQGARDHKFKEVNLYLKKKIDQIKKHKVYSLLKVQIECLVLCINNLDTLENRIDNRSDTRYLKTQQIPRSRPKQKGTLNFTQAMKMSAERSNIKGISLREKSLTESQVSVIRVLSPSRQTLQQRMCSALQAVRRAIPTGQEQSIQICFSDFNSMLAQANGQFFQILNLIATFVDQFLFSDLQKSKVFTKPSLKNFVFEQTLQSMIILNKQNSNIDQEGLKLELQLLLTKIELTNMRTVETLLDSIYMSCSLVSFLRATLSLFKLCGCLYQPIKQFYSSWLSKKVELSDETLLDADEFLKVDHLIYRCLRAKTRNLNSSVESERASFMTPEKEQPKQRSLDSSRGRIQSMESSRHNSFLVSQEVLLVQDLLAKGFLQGINAFQDLMDKRETTFRKSQSNVADNGEFNRITKCICKNIQPQFWNQATRVLIRYRLQHQSQQLSLLYLFFVFSCTKPVFKDPAQNQLLTRFLILLFDDLRLEAVLDKYRCSFEYIYSKMANIMTENFIINTLSFVAGYFLSGDIGLRECEFLINPICFCLMYPSTYDIGNRYLSNIHKGRRSTRGKVEHLIRLKIKDQTLRGAYEQWLNRYAIEQMEIGTISQVPELNDDISNCKSLVQGLQNMNMGKSIASLRFASPIVGLSKISRIESQKMVSFREPSKSSTIQRPLSIMKDFHSSREIMIERSMEHQTQYVNNFEEQKQIKEMDTYSYQKSQLEHLIPQDCAVVEDSIRQLRELFLTSESNPQDIIEHLWQIYTSLENEQREDRFIFDIKTSVSNSNFILSLSQVNYYVLLTFVLKLCSNIPQHRHDALSLQKLRQVLNLLLTFKNPNSVLIMCIRILNHHLSEDLQEELAFQEKLMFRLITNCVQKLSQIIEPQSTRAFQVLLEIYKFFKAHPPEQLVSGVPSLKQIEHIFTVLKKVTNVVIHSNRERSVQFVGFIRRRNLKSIYLTYVAAVIERVPVQ